MKIALVGYMGSGKSTVGKKLAEKLKISFIDLDTEIEQFVGKSISDIFSEEREIKFRKYEREALLRVLDRDDKYVLALGGGTSSYYDNMEIIRKNTKSIYLRLKPRDLEQRLVNEKDIRPLIAHLEKRELRSFISKHLFDRKIFYEQADFIIDLKEKSPDEAVEEILNSLHLS